MKLEKAILILQHAIEERFGRDVDTDTGACTLTIARDRVELHGLDHTIIADGADEASEQLREEAAQLVS